MIHLYLALASLSDEGIITGDGRHKCRPYR